MVVLRETNRGKRKEGFVRRGSECKVRRGVGEREGESERERERERERESGG